MNHSAVQRNGNRFGRLLCSWLMTALLPEGLREPSDRSSPSPAGAAQARSLLLAGPAGRSGRASRVHCCGSRVGNGWLVLRDGQAELAGPAGQSGCTSRVHCCGSRGRRPRHDKPARQSAPGCCWLALGAVRLRRVPAGRCWYLTSAASLMMLVSRGAALAHVARE